MIIQMRQITLKKGLNILMFSLENKFLNLKTIKHPLISSYFDFLKEGGKNQ